MLRRVASTKLTDIFISMPAEFSAQLPELFSDVISFMIMRNPCITPQGTTYDRQEICKWLKLRHSDPLLDVALYETDLTGNQLYGALVKLLFDMNDVVISKTKPMLNLSQFDKLLRCPLSGVRFKEPVVAINGVTYEKIYIECYLESHQNNTPTGEPQSQELIPNLIVASLFDQLKLDNLFAAQLPQRAHAIADTDQDVQAVRDYISARTAQPNYTGSSFGYNKWEKVIASTHLLHAATGEISMHAFFKTHKNEHKALKQGRLRDAAAPLLQRVNTAKN